jgi:hypothetical protein
MQAALDSGQLQNHDIRSLSLHGTGKRGPRSLGCLLIRPEPSSLYSQAAPRQVQKTAGLSTAGLPRDHIQVSLGLVASCLSNLFPLA